MEKQQRKRPIPVDRDTLLDDTPAAELIVKPSAMASDQEPQYFVPNLEGLKDYELRESIRRKKHTLNITRRNLPDRGAKLRAIIGCYEAEVHRRKLNPPPPKFSAVQPKVDEQQMEMPDEASAVGDDATNPVHKSSSDTMQPIISIPDQLADLRTHIDELFQNLRQHVDMRFQHLELRLLALEISLQLIPKP